MRRASAALLRHARLAAAKASKPVCTCGASAGGPRRGAWSVRLPPSTLACSGAARQPPPTRRRRSSTPGAAAAAAAGADAASSSTSTSTVDLYHTPLVERPPAATASTADLAAWVAWARGAVADLGAGGLAADGGPSAAELQSELRWFLEDAVAGLAGPGGAPPPSPPPPGAPPPWSALAPSLADGAGTAPTPSSSLLVWLRAPLADLTARWTARLRDRVPFQYTVGAAHWRDLVLAVGPGVLCPRPETEKLVDLAVEAASAGGGGGAWADVCTGSGAVAVGLVSAFRGAGLRAPDVVWATDVCPVAAGWARANVARSGAGGTVRVVEGDLLAALPAGTPRLRGLLSNPPYIPAAQMAGLQAEVGRHEPHLALDGGDAAGLVTLRRLCSAAAAALAPGGFLGLETAGHGQAEQVAELLTSGSGGRDFEDVAVHEDMCGVVRFVTGRRRM